METLYNELKDDLNFKDKIDKNEVLKIIKEKKFDKENIKEWIKSKLPNNKVDEIVELFEREYGILGII